MARESVLKVELGGFEPEVYNTVLYKKNHLSLNEGPDLNSLKLFFGKKKVFFFGEFESYHYMHPFRVKR